MTSDFEFEPKSLIAGSWADAQRLAVYRRLLSDEKWKTVPQIEHPQLVRSQWRARCGKLSGRLTRSTRIA